MEETILFYVNRNTPRRSRANTPEGAMCGSSHWHNNKKTVSDSAKTTGISNSMSYKSIIFVNKEKNITI